MSGRVYSRARRRCPVCKRVVTFAWNVNPNVHPPIWRCDDCRGLDRGETLNQEARGTSPRAGRETEMTEAMQTTCAGCATGTCHGLRRADELAVGDVLADGARVLGLVAADVPLGEPNNPNDPPFDPKADIAYHVAYVDGGTGVRVFGRYSAVHVAYDRSGE